MKPVLIVPNICSIRNEHFLPILLRDHPFKTSAFFSGGGVSPLPTFADARGVGVSEMLTSAFFFSYQETNSNFECNNMPFFLFQTRLFAQGEHKSSSR